MPDISVMIGGRAYDVSCQPGEESYLESAAAMLDVEAAQLGPQAGRLSEARLLLMSGLMLADKTAGMEEQLRSAQSRLSELEADLADLRQALAAAKREPRVSEAVLAKLQHLAHEAEELAAGVEARCA